MKNDSAEPVLLTCPICCSHDTSIIYRLYDDRYGYPESYDLVECNVCKHNHLKSYLSAQELEDLYTTYYPRSHFNVEDYNPRVKKRGFGAWFDGCGSSAYYHVPDEISILDIGCGFGETLGYHKARGCKVYGVEADRNIKRVADKFGFDVHVGLFDHSVYQEDFFDYITMHQVLEHFVDPIHALKGVQRILKPNGMAVLTLPNVSGWGAKAFGKQWINWHAPYHLQFFSRKSMELAASKAGLVVKKVKTVTSSEWLYYQWIHLAVYPDIGKSSVFWDPLRKPSTLEQEKLNRITKFHRSTKINHLMTRFFDLIGKGDNILYFLKNE